MYSIGRNRPFNPLLVFRKDWLLAVSSEYEGKSKGGRKRGRGRKMEARYGIFNPYIRTFINSYHD